MAGSAHRLESAAPIGADPGEAGQAGQLWEDKAPEPLRQKSDQGAQLARNNREALLAAAAGLTATVWLACRRRKR